MSKKQADIISKQSLTEILLNISDRLNHIEDSSIDTRQILIKLVKQSNEVIKFLKQIEIEEITNEYDAIPSLSERENKRVNKMQDLKELVEEFMDKHSELKEFEEELKKHKDELTPGQIGES